MSESKKGGKNIENKNGEISETDILRKLEREILKEKKAMAFEGNEEKQLIDEILNLEKKLEKLEQASEKELDYEIISHRPIIGPILNRGRSLVNGEIRRYVDPLFDKQNEYNNRLLEFNYNLIEIIIQITDKILKRENFLLKEIRSNILTNKDFDYKSFEDTFRGSPDDIKEKLNIYLEFFNGKDNVLEIGSGRGEFLELLKENSIDSRGIDLNEKMVQHCREMGLKVELADAITYLKGLEDSSLGGIFISQVVEHLQPFELIILVNLCYKKLEKGSFFIVETINPKSVYATHENFFKDLSHTKPIHPDTLKFLIEGALFCEVTIRELSPIKKSDKLEILMDNDLLDNETREFLNNNFERINRFLYGNLDYAIIARK